MRVVLETKPFADMRYPTLGDWFYDADKRLHIIVAADDGTEPLSEKEQKLILMHELVEVWLCEEEGVTQKMVDDFDFECAREHPEYPANSEIEPGDDPTCPYRTQHRRAMLIEHLFAHFMGMDDYGRIS